MAALDFDHSIGINAVSNGVIFHPNGVNYVFAAGGNVVIADLTDSHNQTFLRKHDDIVTCVALSDPGNLIASGQVGMNSNVYVWNYETRELIYSLEEHDHKIVGVSFSSDEKLLATIGNEVDGKLLIWDMSNGYIVSSVTTLPKGTNCVTFVGFVKDIKRRDTNHYMICTAGSEGAMLWDLDPFSGEIEPIKLGGDARSTIFRHVTALTVSEDHETVFAATTSGDYVMISMRSKRIVASVLATKLGLCSIVVHKNGTVVGCGDGTVKCFGGYQTETDGQIQNEKQIDGSPVVSLSLSQDQREVLACTQNGTIVRMNIASCDYISVAENHTKPIVAIAFAAGVNDRFASASMDGTIKVWDMMEYSVCCTARMRSNQPRGSLPTCLSFSNILLSGWSDGKILAHDADNGSNLWFIDNAHVDGVSALTLSHNSRFILSGGHHGELRLWEMRSRELISHLKEHGQAVSDIVLLPDDTQAISSSRDRSILRWDLRLERRVFCHQQRMGGVNSITITGDTKHILSVGQERRLVKWGMNNPVAETYRILDGGEEQDEGRAVEISHDGSLIATGGSTGVVRLWDACTFELLSEVTGHSDVINSLKFTPDDKQIISGGEDGSIFCWCVFKDEP